MDWPEVKVQYTNVMPIGKENVLMPGKEKALDVLSLPYSNRNSDFRATSTGLPSASSIEEEKKLLKEIEKLLQEIKNKKAAALGFEDTSVIKSENALNTLSSASPKYTNI